MNSSLRSLFYQLMLAIAVLLFAGCAGGSATLAPEQERAGSLQEQLVWIAQSESYITTDPAGIIIEGEARPIQQFDTVAAAAGGMTPEGITFAMKLTALSNTIAAQPSIVSDESQIAIDPELEAFFRALTADLEAGGQTSVRTLAAGCGGWYDAPAACEARESFSLGLASKAAVESHLRGQGYHKTAWYATTSYGNNYTKALVNEPCGNGVYRYEAQITKFGTTWGYVRQRDLNPEVFAQPLASNYPMSGWISYCYWWHKSYCN